MQHWKDTLILLQQELKERGFSAKGTNFHRVAASGNWLVVSLQQSVKSDDVASIVTLNYGVYSKRLLSKVDGVQKPRTWDASGAHWRKRLREDGREKWLHLPTSLAPLQATRELLVAFDAAITELSSHASDESLRDEWLTGAASGITAMQRLLYLAVLLNEIGPTERLAETVAELRALVSTTGTGAIVEQRLATAGIKAS
jgi:hypothetical protein